MEIRNILACIIHKNPQNCHKIPSSTSKDLPLGKGVKPLPSSKFFRICRSFCTIFTTFHKLSRLAILTLFFSSLSATDFITGNAFKAVCEHSYDEFGYNYNPDGLKGYWFVKTDKLDSFFGKNAVNSPFVLLTHNADHGVTFKHKRHIENKNLIHWFGQNLETEHPKLSSIPIGLCNFANFDVMEEVMAANHPKSNLVYANYNIWTNFQERNKCKEKTGVPLAKLKPFKDYLEDVSRSYFVISPNGNGVDCHRTWEALYLKAIPIVTKSYVTIHYKHFPIIILDSWDDYKDLQLSKELYEEMWNDFDLTQFTVFDFLNIDT